MSACTDVPSLMYIFTLVMCNMIQSSSPYDIGILSHRCQGVPTIISLFAEPVIEYSVIDSVDIKDSTCMIQIMLKLASSGGSNIGLVSMLELN